MATKSVKETAKVVNKNKTKYILIITSAIILPAGIILGPIAIAREIKRDKKKQSKKDEDSGNPDSSFSFPKTYAKIY